ncbi:unnamed protein product [Phytophthora fragariaefolia]|uniref:Unnamed protein product n=1 Tax=Phytophthora fragariaefolia TaxID=1490495 RepID=A0A9W7CZ01_9STRA|nr:unnamed protein product [Phytophthora fragariaefolia]
MELSQLRFKVYHKAGSFMGHVDGLSRLYSDSVCAVSMADLLNDADTDERCTPLVGEGSAGDVRDSETPNVYPGPAGHGSAEVGESGPVEGDLAEPSGVPTDQLLVSPVDGFGLQQDRFLAEQRRTPWIRAVLAYLESGALALDPQMRTRTLLMAPNYAVRNGVLMRRVHLKSRAGPANSLEVPVIPIQFISTVLHHCHTDVLTAHVGVTKTMDKVRKHAFWPGWKRDVAEYVRECSICGSGKGHRPWRNGLMQRMPIHELSGPFSLLVVDAVGPLVWSALFAVPVQVLRDGEAKYGRYGRMLRSWWVAGQITLEKFGPKPLVRTARSLGRYGRASGEACLLTGRRVLAVMDEAGWLLLLLLSLAIHVPMALYDLMEFSLCGTVGLVVLVAALNALIYLLQWTPFGLEATSIIGGMGLLTLGWDALEMETVAFARWPPISPSAMPGTAFDRTLTIETSLSPLDC